jgi:hypothetical protein
LPSSSLQRRAPSIVSGGAELLDAIADQVLARVDEASVLGGDIETAVAGQHVGASSRLFCSLAHVHQDSAASIVGLSMQNSTRTTRPSRTCHTWAIGTS